MAGRKPDTRILVNANLFAIRHQQALKLSLNHCIGCRGRTLGFRRSSNLSSHVRRRVRRGLLGRKATIPRPKLALHVVAVVRVIDHPQLAHGFLVVVTGLKQLQLRRRCATCVQKVYYYSGQASLHLVHMSPRPAAAVPSLSYTSKSSF
jgi:hypothetical protein